MKVAIIGANGFVGTRLLEIFQLGNGEFQPVAIVRRPSALATACRFAVEWRLGDALKVDSLAAALKDCEAVVHCAIGDPRQIIRMPRILCEAASRAGIRRVVYLSSASVHGQAPEPGTTEETPLKTGHFMEYNDAKIRAERDFFKACRQFKIEGFALRPGVVYGPRSRWIADLANDLRQGRAWLHGKGDAVLNGIYVDNLCEAIRLCLKAPADKGGHYLVNDAEARTWGDFTLETAKALGVSESSIHHPASLPVPHRELRQKIKDAIAGPFVQSVLPLFPYALKSNLKRLLEAPPQAPDSWRLPGRPSPRFTDELVLLQQCTWRLPNQKAETALGYRPKVSAQEGLRRSLAWLAFAEGRPC